jgi:hypothetical protein
MKEENVAGDWLLMMQDGGHITSCSDERLSQGIAELESGRT